MKLGEKRILITGGAGFIGSHLVDALSSHDVVVLDDFSTGHRRNLAQHETRSNIRIVEGDLRDRELLDRLLPSIDVVFHLACRGVRHSIGNPRENHEINATGTLTLLEAASAAGVQRFVHVSSSEVYGTARTVPMDENHPCFPETAYGAAKLAGECYARAYHQTYSFSTIVVRPFNNFGPRSHFEADSGEVIPRFAVLAFNGKQPVVFGGGEQTREFIYVEETAAWLLRIAETDQLLGQTINLGSGFETSVNALAEKICCVAGCTDLKPVYVAPRPGDVRRLLAATSLAQRVLRFYTQIGLAEGMRKYLDYLKRFFSVPEELLSLVQGTNWSFATHA